MLKYTLRRFFYMIVTIWLIVTVTFIMMHNLPGDPFENSERMTAQQKAQLSAQYGLDKPIWEQYVLYVGDVAKGDLGVSYAYPTRKVNEVIRDAFPNSLELGIWSILIALIMGLVLGIVAALNHNKGLDYGAMFLAVLGVSIPSFVLAPLLSYFIGVKAGWLPPGLWYGPEHRVLPAISLSFATLAILARLMRTSMLDVINQDYVKTAKAKGLSSVTIVWRHTLRNAILPVITILGPIFVNIITGTLVVEQIFSIPGLGKHFVQSVYSNDYSMIAGLTIFYAAILIVVMFFTDIIYGLVDPRIRLVKGRG